MKPAKIVQFQVNMGGIRPSYYLLDENGDVWYKYGKGGEPELLFTSPRKRKKTTLAPVIDSAIDLGEAIQRSKEVK